MKLKDISYNNSGLTLIELMIAVALFTTVMVIATGFFGRAIESQTKTAAAKTSQESLDYALNFMKKEAEQAKQSLAGCGGAPATHSFFYSPSSDQVYFRNKNEICVRYFLQTDSNGIKRIVTTRDGLPAAPYFLYLTSGDTIINGISFDRLLVPDLAVIPDARYPSAKLTIAVEGRSVGGVITDTINFQTSVVIKPFVCGQYIIDRDNYSYKTVQIGSQCWMAENLKTKRKLSGACINSGASFVSPACIKTVAGIQYGGEDGSGRDCIIRSSPTTIVRGASSQCDLGYTLYRWSAAMDLPSTCDTSSCSVTAPYHQGICPLNWHVPTDTEQDQLVQELGGLAEAGQYLKASPVIPGSSGYNAIMTGDRDPGTGNFFTSIDDYDTFWTATQMGATTARFRFVARLNPTVVESTDPKKWSVALRCLKD